MHHREQTWERCDIVENYRPGVSGCVDRPMDLEKSTGAVRQLGMHRLLLGQPAETAGAKTNREERE